MVLPAHGRRKRVCGGRPFGLDTRGRARQIDPPVTRRARARPMNDEPRDPIASILVAQLCGAGVIRGKGA